MIAEMKAETIKDLLGEGVRPDDVNYSIELELSMNGADAVSAPCPEETLASALELRAAIYKALDSDSSLLDPANMSPRLVRLRAKKAMAKLALIERELLGADPSHARIGSRRVLWKGCDVEAQIYRWEALQPGNSVGGCAVLEGVNTTYFIPEGWVLVVDRFGNGAIGKQGSAGFSL